MPHILNIGSAAGAFMPSPLHGRYSFCEFGYAATGGCGTDTERAWAGPSGHLTIRVSDGGAGRVGKHSVRAAIAPLSRQEDCKPRRVVKASDIIKYRGYRASYPTAWLRSWTMTHYSCGLAGHTDSTGVPCTTGV